MSKNAYPGSDFSFFGDADIFIGGFTSQSDGILWHSFNYKHHWKKEKIYIYKWKSISHLIRMKVFKINPAARFDVISQYQTWRDKDRYGRQMEVERTPCAFIYLVTSYKPKKKDIVYCV